MNKFSLLIACLAFVTTVAKAGYEFTFHITDLPEGTVYLGHHYANKQVVKDSVKLKNGKAVFKGDEDAPGGLYLFVFPGQSEYFEFVVSGEEDKFSITTSQKDYIKDFSSKGSKENEQFYQYINYLSNKKQGSDPLRKMYSLATDPLKKQLINNQLKELDADILAYQQQFILKNNDLFVSKIIKSNIEIVVPEPPVNAAGAIDSNFKFKYYKEHYFDNIDLSDDRMIRTPAVVNKVTYYLEKMVVKAPDSVLNAYERILGLAAGSKEITKYYLVDFLNQTVDSKVMGMDKVYVHLVEKYFIEEEMEWLDHAQLFRIQAQAKSWKPILIGKKAPPFRLEDAMGMEHHAYGFNSKYTMLYFYDPDCGHCQTQTKKLVPAYESIMSKGIDLKVLAVCGTPEEEKWLKYTVDNMHKDWVHVADFSYESDFRTRYDLTGYPRIFILDENKIIIAKRLGAEQVEDFLDRHEKLMNEK